MNGTTAPALSCADPARFGEAFRSVGADLQLTPRDVWVITDAAFFAHAAGSRNVDTVLAMADMHHQAAALVALFYLYLLDLWVIDQESHDAILRAIDPSFDPDGASE